MSKVLRTLVKEELARRVSESHVNGYSALDYVCDWISDGKTLKVLVAELIVTLDGSIAQSTLLSALNEDFGKEAVAQALANARKEGAHALVEEAQDLIDDVTADRDYIAKAKEQVALRTWRASRANRAAYGDEKNAAVIVNVNHNTLHLDALRVKTVAHPAQLTPAQRITEQRVPLLIESRDTAEIVEPSIELHTTDPVTDVAIESLTTELRTTESVEP